MCGIAGFIDFNGSSDKAVLEKMTRALAHRGPDGEGYFLTTTPFATVGLGHRRLSIIDLSTAASQPMQYKQWHLVFNGEIYNFNEVKAELLATGHHFSTSSDTEVILHAYEEWGTKAVDRFHGMFSVVIFDEVKNQIIAFRDRPGVKPFFYYWHKGLFLFGSELKAFHEHPLFEKQVNLSAVAAFLQYGNVPTPQTIFNNTRKLPPAHWLILNLGDRTIHEEQYWSVYDAYNQPKLDIGEEEAIRETEAVLKKAVEYRMVADVPVGVFLSGGYDSSCVTALLQKDRTEKIKTFSIGMTDKKLDEAVYAKKVANYLGTDHTEYYCTEKEAIEMVPSLPFVYDEPFADSSAIPTMLVSKMAREKVTVALSADAGDEVFAGYNKYEIFSGIQRKLGKSPKTLSRAGSKLMAAIPVGAIPGIGSKPGFVNRYHRLKRILNDPGIKSVFEEGSKLFTINELDKLLLVKPVLPASNYRSDKLQQPYFDPLSYMMAIDYETYLLDDILQKVDRASMCVGLESREPFLDQSVIEWAAKLPSDLKFRNGEKKYILKQIVHRHLPREMMERPKMGFSVAIGDWVRNIFKDLVYQYCGEEYIRRQGIFNVAQVDALLYGFYEKRNIPAEKIWYLLMFQMWYDRWIKLK